MVGARFTKAFERSRMYYTKTVLDNGITVMSERMESVQSVSLGLWFAVGSRDEQPSQAGLSHFIEHMMFKGTPTRGPLEISSAFESMGAELNAFTSKESTCYYARFVDSHLEDALEVLSDMVKNSLMRQEDIDLEREVVLEEIARALDTPDDYVFDLFSEALLPGHPVAKPVLGDPAIIGNATHELVMEYFNERYTSGNLAVVAAGNVDHAHLVELVKKHLGDMRQGPREVRTVAAAEKNLPTAFHEKDTEQAHVCLGFPGVDLGDERRFAASILDTIFGGGMSSRLFQEVREKRGLVYAISAFTLSYTDTGKFCVYAGSRPENVEEVISLIRSELARMVKDGITDEELDRVKEYLVGLTTLNLESTSARMRRLGSREVTDCPQLSLAAVIEAYRAVTKEEVNELARELYAQEPTIAIISPYDERTLRDMIHGERKAG